MKDFLDKVIAWFDPFTVVLAIILLVIGLIFSPTRIIITFLFKGFLKGSSKIAGIVFTGTHEVFSSVFQAHYLYFKNWLPRQTVIPSVREDKSTRRL
ncbi:MAG: hypothetical protein DDT34_01910 [Firmicutes bacterium]|nr:hypothetical protein [Bacillota bacterium]MBT9165413.1 hypothetical protein [Chloroflexota bacterium]